MKKYAISTLFYIFLLTTCWANNDPGNNSYWQCTAHDKLKKECKGTNTYERVASSKAFEACKKESSIPMSCKTDKDYCYYFTEGTTNPKRDIENRSMWHCSAIDQQAKYWVSNLYSNQDEAVLAAKSLCQKHSPIPDSCYVNLITCKKIGGT